MRRLAPAILLCLALHLALRPLGAQAPTVTQIAASWHILALLSDGTVSAMSENRFGQLGRPKSDPLRFLPAARVDLPGKAVQVAVGDEYASYALLENGTVWAWGHGGSNNLGVRLSGARERHTPAQVPGLTGVARIVAARTSVMAVMRDGSVRAWGEVPPLFTGGERVFPGVATPIVISGLAGVTDIAGGPGGGYALTREGRVYAWGGNAKGELGTGTAAAEIRAPALVPGVSDLVSIATVNGAAVAVTRDGRLWSWGSNEQAGLGHGTQADVTEPGQPTPAVLPGVTDAVEVKAGTLGRQFIVRRRTGTLIGWGNSDWGQLGAGVAGDFQPTPTPIKLPDVEAYWLGGNFSFARTKDGTLWFWGEEFAARGLLGLRGNQRIPVRVPVTKLIPD
jgi:alpha-tubulin suppressor-like RCC1 family protein